MELMFITMWLPESFFKFGSKPLQLVYAVANSNLANSLHVETVKCLIDKISFYVLYVLMLDARFFFPPSDQRIGSNI